MQVHFAKTIFETFERETQAASILLFWTAKAAAFDPKNGGKCGAETCDLCGIDKLVIGAGSFPAKVGHSTLSLGVLCMLDHARSYSDQVGGPNMF